VETIATNEKAREVPAKRGMYAPFGEYHQCWYPVLVAEAIKQGEVRSVKFCDSRIAVFRGSEGVVRAVSARCKHMGADLGLGKVVGNHVQCPYHHWEYNEKGACVRIPSGDPIPGDTTLFSFPCEESQGLIWVFLGKEPTYDVPAVPGCEEGKVLSRTFQLVLDEPLRVEPWVFGTNLFDFAHFKAVHNFNMRNVKTFIDEHHMGWESDIEGIGFMRAQVAGVATAITYVKKDGKDPQRHIAGITPQGDEGLGIFFTIFADLADDSKEAHVDALRRLDEYEALHRHLPAEDLPILNSIQFGQARLTKADRELATFLNYVNKYPRTTIKELQGEQ
jgi:nitrite reductase/ring-hydroxylating ferredoxin subunit